MHDPKYLSKITTINEVYFGADKTKNYVKHDFKRALEGFVQREVLLHVVMESSKARHNTIEKVDDTGRVISISHGDFDPDNAGFLYSVFKNHELGAMLDLRLLLTKKESFTGGSLVKDLIGLVPGDFISYYLYKKPESTVIPPLLTGAFIESRKNNSYTNGADFISNHEKDITRTVELLVASSEKFNNSNYKDKIIANYEALKFHKNKQPAKYDFKEVKEDFGPLSVSKTTRTDKAQVESKLISKALNEFAEIVHLYQLLVGGNVELSSPSWSLDTYVKRTFQLFQKQVPLSIQEKVIADFEKYLSTSLNVAGWSIK